MLFHIILLKQTPSHRAGSALWPCLEQEAMTGIYALLENTSKVPHALQGHQCLLTGLHWDHHRCQIWFKKETHVQQDNNKRFILPAMLDWQTHSHCSDWALFTGSGHSATVLAQRCLTQVL